MKPTVLKTRASALACRNKHSNLLLPPSMKLNLAFRIATVIFGLTALSTAQSSVINMNQGTAPPNISYGILLLDGGNTPYFGDPPNVTRDLSMAVTVDRWVGSIVSNSTGAFSGIAGNSAVFYFDGWVIGAPQPNLWQVGGVSFNLQSATTTFFSTPVPGFPGAGDFLRIDGQGVLNGPGFSNTPANWTFATQGRGTPYFSWSSSTSTVPDGGTTIALLGCSLLGLHGLRRKLAKH